MSSIVVDFNGEKLPLSGLGKYSTSNDRNIRKQASVALGTVIEQNKAQLDEIYDKLVKHRTNMGKLLGYENFSPLGYDHMGRNCYGKEDIATFRANVKKHLVPLVSEIKEKVKSDLGLEDMFLYDDSVYTADEPKPIGTPEEIFANGAVMYNKMGAETGELFDLMQKCEAFDALSRQGKWGGGYCTDIPKYGIPFILSNFNGSSDDIGVGGKAIVEVAFVLYLDMDFSHIIGTSCDGLDQIFFQFDFFAYQFSDCLECRIYRAVAG
jgi:M3 family oligoendopeptidase